MFCKTITGILIVFFLVQSVFSKSLWKKNYALLIGSKKVGWVEKSISLKDNVYHSIEKTFMSVERLGINVFVRQTGISEIDITGKPIKIKTIRNENGKYNQSLGEFKYPDELHFSEKRGEESLFKIIKIPVEEQIIVSSDFYLYQNYSKLTTGIKKFKMFIPETGNFSSCVFNINKNETFTIGNKKYTGTKVSIVMEDFGGIEIEQILDRNGIVIAGKMGIISFYEETSDKIKAFDNNSDILSSFEILCKVKGNLKNPRKATYIVKRVDGDIHNYFIPFEGSQTNLKNNVLEIINKKLNIDDIKKEKWQKKNGINSSVNYISYTKEMKSTAEKIVVNCKNKYEAVNKLNSWVYKNLKKTASVLFDSAENVFIGKQGDCTEHSVLLVSLLNSVGIESRCVIGAVVQKEKLIYHMWVEFKHKDRWISVDPALNQFPVDIFHLKMGNCENDVRASFFSSSAKLMQSGPHLEIELKLE